MSTHFQASTEQLPASDPHDEMVKRTDAACARLREMCWKMRDLVKAYHKIRQDYEADVRDGNPPALEMVLEPYRECSAIEREILAVRERIEQEVANYNFGRDTSKRIYLSHTEEGLPIRVSKQKKVPLWGI